MGRLVDPALLGTAVARPPLLLALRQRPVLEADGELPALDGDGAPAACGHEAALPAVGLLDVVLLVVGRGDLEADAPRRLASAGREGVGGVVLRRLDVVLVRVGPVQLHLLPVVGDEVGGPAAARVAALRDEVALGVVTGEEVGEMVVDVGLGVRVLLHLGEPAVQLDDPGRGVEVGVVAESSGRLAVLLQLPLQLGPLLGAGQVQLRLHLRQQIAVEERGDLGRFQVHDPVQAKVQIAPVELEHLAQQGLQPAELVRGARSRPRTVWRGAGCGRVGHSGIIGSRLARCISAYRIRMESGRSWREHGRLG